MTPHTPERRVNAHRREEDLEADVAKWVLWLTKRRTRLVFLASMASSVFTLVVGAAFTKFFDPARDIRRVEMKVDTTIKRVSDLEVRIMIAKSERDSLKEQLRWIIYMQCGATRRTEPAAYLPPVCKSSNP